MLLNKQMYFQVAIENIQIFKTLRHARSGQGLLDLVVMVTKSAYLMPHKGIE